MRSIPPPNRHQNFSGAIAPFPTCAIAGGKCFCPTYLMFLALALFLAFYLPFASFHFAVNFIASELCDLQLDKREPGVAISSSLFGNS